MDKIYVGKIVGYHGIKGELKLVSDFEYVDRVVLKNKKIFFNDEVVTISSVRVHKKNFLITINSLFDLNLVDQYIKSDVFINRSDLVLLDGEYLFSDLIDFSIICDDVIIGKVSNILINSNCKFLEVSGSKKFLIPFVDDFIDCVNFSEKNIVSSRAGELIL